MHLVVAGTKDAINMVEAGCDEVPEKVVLEGILFGHKTFKKLVDSRNRLLRPSGRRRWSQLAKVDEELESRALISPRTGSSRPSKVVEKQARQEALGRDPG